MDMTALGETERRDIAEFGMALRAAREARGYHLNDVVAELHIHGSHLQALEAGRLDLLPGPAYAVGFLRTYSDFLGLECDSIIARVKIMMGQEAAERKPLSPPGPVEENRLPTRQVLVFAALICVLAYMGWYFLSSEESDVAERTGVPPSALLEDPVSEDPDPADELSPEPADTAQNDTADNTAADNGKVEQPQTAEAGQAEEEPNSSGSAQAALPRQTEEDSASTDEIQPPTLGSPGTSRPASTPDDSISTTIPRIVLHAVQDSWIRVRSSDGQVVFSRVMRPGTKYTVPPNEDLMLETGNAGGLQVIVDGKPISPLGPSGAVRRRIPLDAEALLKR